MRNKLSKFFNQAPDKGFTLIELLVVLGILGILAAALLATINPIEQLNRARDTSLKNLSAQFVQATVRYYSVNSALPWSSTAAGGDNCYTGGTTLSSVSLSNLSGCVTTLISDGELKESFINSNDQDSVLVTNPNPQTGGVSDVIVCFMPESEAQQEDPNTRYSQTGASAASCKSQGGTNDCYWCAQ